MVKNLTSINATNSIIVIHGQLMDVEIRDVVFKNINLGYNMRMVSIRALIFNMSVPCDKASPWIPNIFII